MLARVERLEGESLEVCLRRFQGAVHAATRKPWYKTRVVAYQKPGYRRRQKEASRQRNIRIQRYRSGRVCARLSLQQQFSRTDPFVPMRKYLKPGKPNRYRPP